MTRNYTEGVAGGSHQRVVGPRPDRSLFFHCGYHDAPFSTADGCPFCNIHGGPHRKWPDEGRSDQRKKILNCGGIIP